MPVAWGNGPRISNPHYANGQGLLTGFKCPIADGLGGHASNTTRICIHIQRHPFAFATTKILESLPGKPGSIPPHDYRIPPYAILSKLHLPSPNVGTKGMALQRTSDIAFYPPITNNERLPNELCWPLSRHPGYNLRLRSQQSSPSNTTRLSKLLDTDSNNANISYYINARFYYKFYFDYSRDVFSHSLG